MKKTQSKRAFLESPFRSIKFEHYFEIYDELFRPFFNKPITFVEIGVLDGGSLFMWRELFGAKARIIGIDLNPSALRWVEYGFEIYIGSQSDPNFLVKIANELGAVDIILDDGGHTYLQQLVSFKNLIDTINFDGLYVVEDTHTSYSPGFGPKKFSFIEHTKIIIDEINSREVTQLHRRKLNYVESMKIFKSIVAFRVRPISDFIQLVEVSNEKIKSNVRDFRHSDNSILNKFLFLKSIKTFKYLKFPSIFRNFYLNKLVIFEAYKNYIHRYFK